MTNRVEQCIPVTSMHQNTMHLYYLPPSLPPCSLLPPSLLAP